VNHGNEEEEEEEEEEENNIEADSRKDSLSDLMDEWMK